MASVQSLFLLPPSGQTKYYCNSIIYHCARITRITTHRSITGRIFLSTKHARNRCRLQEGLGCVRMHGRQLTKSNVCSYLHLSNKMTETGEGDPRFDRRRRHDYRQLTRKRERLHNLSVNFREKIL